MRKKPIDVSRSAKLTKLQIEWLSDICKHGILRPAKEDRTAGAVLTGLVKKGLIQRTLLGCIPTEWGHAVNACTDIAKAKDWTRSDRRNLSKIR